MPAGRRNVAGRRSAAAPSVARSIWKISLCTPMLRDGEIDAPSGAHDARDRSQYGKSGSSARAARRRPRERGTGWRCSTARAARSLRRGTAPASCRARARPPSPRRHCPSARGRLAVGVHRPTSLARSLSIVERRRRAFDGEHARRRATGDTTATEKSPVGDGCFRRRPRRRRSTDAAA